MREASVVLFVIALSMPVSLFADYKMAFREGVRAYEKQQWAHVVVNMRTAIAQQSRSNERINIRGGWSEPYIPQHYLAAALAHLNQCAAARKARGEGGAVTGSEKFRKLVSEKCGSPKNR